MTLYAMAVPGRFGLGHSLLAWGRSVVWAQQHDAKLIAPNWLQLRIGPYLRRERDKRFYYKLFQSGQQIGGLRRLILLQSSDRMPVEAFAVSPGRMPGGKPLVVEFRNALADNEKKFFHEIFGHSALVHAALLDMTKPRFRPGPTAAPHIAIHIRGGDFGIASSVSDIQAGAHNIRLPVTWYANMLTALRSRLGPAINAVVYSDCTDSEIAPVLSLNNVTRSANRESITDMLEMAKASVLISSGSGFSRWGSYLGQVPRLCYPGQRGVRVISKNPLAGDSEPEVLDASTLPNDFVSHIEKRLSPSRNDNHFN